jgi:hypothetical protein
MAVRFLKNVNRLTARVGRRGVSRADAVAQAEANVQTLKDSGVARVDALIETLKSLVSGAPSDPTAVCRSIYDAANSLGGIAGVFGFPAMGRAAYGLCDLMDLFEAGGPINLKALGVHLNALELFRHPASLSDAEVTATLDHMAHLRAHLASKSHAASRD